MAIDQQNLATLMARASSGDVAAFRTIYESTSPILLALLMRILPSRDLAEDVLQDSFLRAWRSAGSYSSGKGSVLSWLARIARNRAIDVLREAHHERHLTGLDAQLFETVADPAPDIAESLSVSQEFALIAPSLRQLSGGERKSIELTYLQGLTVPEVASELSVPLGTAKSWVRRGLQKLRAPTATPALASS